MPSIKMTRTVSILVLCFTMHAGTVRAMAADVLNVNAAGEVTIINPKTGEVLASLLPPEAGFKKGQSFLSKEQQAQCPPPSASGAAGQPLKFLGKQVKGQDVIIRWGGNKDFEIILTFRKLSKPRCVRVRVAGKWIGKNIPNRRTGVEVWCRIPLRIAGKTIKQGVSFTYENWNCEKNYFEITDDWNVHWGSDAFRFDNCRKVLYLPLASFSANGRDYLNVLIDPRSSFTVGVSGSRLQLSRKLFILPKKGASDDAIDLKDGLPPAYHEFYVGPADVENSRWEALYWDYLLALYPYLMKPAEVKMPRNVLVGWVANFPLTDKWAQRLYSFGIRIGGVLSRLYLTDEYLRQVGALDISQTGKLGVLLTPVVLNRYASDPKKERGYGIPIGAQRKEFLWENVKDSILFAPDGKPRDVWNGMGVNMSPEFSFAQRTLAAVKDRLARLGYGGVSVDYYLDGSNADYGRTFGRYPFYPQTASDGMFLKRLSEIVHQDGKYLLINGPAPPLISTNRFYDLLSMDCTSKVVMQFKMQSVYKPFVYYGGSTYPEDAFTTKGWLKEGFRGLLYGCAIAPWAFQPEGADRLVNNVFFLVDVERGRPLFARNAYLGSRLARSAICGGNLDDKAWAAFRHREGSRYLVALNATAKPVKREIPLNLRRLALQSDVKYALVEWNLERGGALRAAGLSAAEIAARKWTVQLAPDEIRILCIEPQKDPLVLDYFAHLGPGFPWLRSSTDRVLSAGVVKKGPVAGPLGYRGSPQFTIKGYPGVQFEMQFGYDKGSTPGHIAVAGAKEYAIKMADGIIRVWGTQSGDTTVNFDSADDNRIALAEGETKSVFDAFTTATVIYDMDSSRREDWKTRDGQWSFQNGRLSQQLISAGDASAILDKSWDGDYELTFRTTMKLAAEKPKRPTLTFLIGHTDGKDVYIGKNPDGKPFPPTYPNVLIGKKAVARGLDLAIHPNRYTRHSRSYDWRIRRRNRVITVDISYDNGLTFENIVEWQCAKDFTPRFGVICANAALVVEKVQLKSKVN